MQKINIKNARRLETEIDNELYYITNSLSSFGSTTYPTVAEAVNFSDQSVIHKMDKVSELQSVKFAIREGIGKFNKEKGIDDLTLSIAILNSKLDLYENAMGISEPQDRMKYLPNNQNTTVYTGGISGKYKEDLRIECKRINREIQRLKDKCIGINSSGTIELSEENISLVKQMGLLD